LFLAPRQRPRRLVVRLQACCFEALQAQGGNVGAADWCQTSDGIGAATFGAEVIPDYPASHCFVTEWVESSAVETETGCESLAVNAGDGDCFTITNTVFYEAIPALSRNGLAVLAPLMLAAGLLGVRRLA